MNIKSDAGIVAKYFINITSGRATPAIMKKTVSQAKTLLKNGYTKDEIIEVIDYLINKQKTEIYSLGYVITSINNILYKIKNEKTIKNKNKLKEIIVKHTEQQEKQRSEVVRNPESSHRNNAKANRFGIQSRFRKKYFSDLFEGH